MGVSKTSDHIHINIKMQNPNFKQGCIKTSDHIQIKIKMPTPVRILQYLQSPKAGLKGKGCSLHLQNKDRDPIFRLGLYQNAPFLKYSQIPKKFFNFKHFLTIIEYQGISFF